MKLSFIFFFLLSIFFSTVKAQVYVKQDAAGLNDGTSWQNAYTNLDTAIIRTEAGAIWIAKGNYKPSLPFNGSAFVKVFAVTKKIALFGGFKGDETELSQRDIEKNSTILNGDTGVEGDSTDNTPRVVMIYGTGVDSNTVLDGLTVKGAYYIYGHGFDYDNAAIMINGNGTSNPVIRNCTIKENVGFYGAGIWVNNSRPLITGNMIINNTAFQGAGIYCSEYLSNPQIIANRISNNRCVGGLSHLAGGGIKVSAYSSPYIYGNLIENNYADYGGAIANESNYEIAVVSNVITNNAGKDGGAVYVHGSGTKMINNLIAGNYAQRSGGALYLDYTIMELTNNTITHNSSNEHGGAFYISDGKLLATNNIVYSNPSLYYKPVFIYVGNRQLMPRFNYNDMEDGINSIQLMDTTLRDSVWQQGNISLYPGFADTLNYNFQLTSQSPCINKGQTDTAALYLPGQDIALNKRLSGNVIDMGCYEFDNTVNTDQGIATSPNDIKLDGRADSSFTLHITGTGNWNIENIATWLLVNNKSGIGNTEVTVTATANPNLLTARSTKILVRGNRLNVPGIPVRINQSRAGYLSLSMDTAYISDDNFHSAYFTLKSNSYWGANTVNWLHVSPFSGSAGTYSIYVSADSNLTGNTRTYRLVFGNEYFNPQISDTIVIAQLPTKTKICAGSTIKLYAGLAGSAYLWQENKGTRFIDISDNGSFSGTNTNVLTINNIPSSSYGTQYRCLVYDVIGNVYTIQIANYWNGVTTAWEAASNWSCGKVPDSNTDVINFNGNIVISSNVTVRSLTLSNGASINVMPGYTLTILH